MIFQRCTSTQLNHKGIFIAYTQLFLAPQLSAIYSHCVGEPSASLASFFFSPSSVDSHQILVWRRLKSTDLLPPDCSEGPHWPRWGNSPCLAHPYTHTHTCTKTHLSLEPSWDGPSLNPFSITIKKKYEFTRVYMQIKSMFYDALQLNFIHICSTVPSLLLQ